MGGSTSQTTKHTQTTSLPGAQQENVDLLMSGAKNLYNSGGPQYYPGKNYTSPTQNQVLGRELITNYAQGAGQGIVNEAQAANSYWMNPANVYDLNKNPGYSGMRQGIVDTTRQQLLEQYLPANRGAAIAGGQLGGSRQGQMDALAMGRASGELGQALANLDFNTSGRQMQMASQALDRSPTMFNLGTQPGNLMSQVGTAQRADEAERLTADMARWEFDQNKEGKLLALLQALTGTSGQYGGTTTGKQTTRMNSDPTGQILGGLLMAGSMFMGGGAGAAAGAAGSGAGNGMGMLGAFGSSY